MNSVLTLLCISGNDIEDKDLRKKCRSRNDGSKFDVPCTNPNAEWRSTKVEELKPVDFDKVKPPEPRVRVEGWEAHRAAGERHLPSTTIASEILRGDKW